ncbi:MAG: mechanosensitive ion channel [Actinomycetia bacterium]|nr:mechanosensitive ion channel [Actinomycetes bacterium]
MNEIASWLKEVFGLSPELQSKIIITLITLTLFTIIRLLVLKIVFRKIKDVKSRYQWRKISSYVVFILVALLTGRLWFEGFQSFATFLGLASAGIAIALKDVIVNFAAWVFIIWKRPFEVGDRIEIGNRRGDVIDLQISQFTLMEIGNWVNADQSTGRIIHIPNGRVFIEPLANYSKGFQYIWNEIPILVTFESNWEKAKDVLQIIANEHSKHLSDSALKEVKKAAKKFLIFYSKLTPTVYTNIEESGVLLTVRYLCRPRNRRGSAEAIIEDILKEFSKNKDIDLAYPTRRTLSTLLESKPKSYPKPTKASRPPAKRKK